ncbi:MAG: histidine phosphatase family protein [Treponema sp.]|nr:histidine phosphatase family protein [Treponema sp.]
MKLKSIYEHMEKAAEKVPSGENCKIIFRHSIREKIIAGQGRDVELSDEGVELAKSFGRHLEYDLGFVASSSCKRNIQTCEQILLGKSLNIPIAIASKELEYSYIKNFDECAKIFKEYNGDIKSIFFDLRTKGLNGFCTVQEASNIILDYIFFNGNQKNTVDLFCTHDFQMAILHSHLFASCGEDRARLFHRNKVMSPTATPYENERYPKCSVSADVHFAKSIEGITENKWPMMLEGMILWGCRNRFFCLWRNKMVEFVNHS